MRVSINKVAFTLAALGVCAFGYSYATEYAQTQSARASACRALFDQAVHGGQELSLIKAPNGDFFRAALIASQTNKKTLSVSSSSGKELSGVMCPIYIADNQAYRDDEEDMIAYHKAQDGRLVIDEVTNTRSLNETMLEQGLLYDHVEKQEATGYQAYDKIIRITEQCEFGIKRYNYMICQAPH